MIAAELQAVVDALGALATDAAPRTIQIPAGAHTFTTPILVSPNLKFAGVPGRTSITASFDGAADDPDNAVFLLPEAVGAGATTLAVEAQRGAIQATMAATPGTWAPGDWVRFSGNDSVLGDTDMGQSIGGDVVEYEVIQILALPGGNVVQFGDPVTGAASRLRHHHAVGKDVVDVVPVRNVTFADLRLSGGAQTVACGISARGAQGVRVERVSGERFSRSVVCADRGAADGYIHDVLIRGACNGAVYLDSAHAWKTWLVRNAHGCEPFHPEGVRRFVYFERNGCASCSLDGLAVDGLGLYGLGVWGSYWGSFENIRIEYCDATGAAATMTAAGEQGLGGRDAYVWLGTGVIDIAEFGYGCTFRNVKCLNNVGPDAWTSQVWWHDHFILEVSDVQALTMVDEGVATDSYVGIRVHDCSGHFKGMQSFGHAVALLIENDPSGYTLRDVTLVPAAPAQGGVAALYLDCITARQAAIDGLNFGNAGFTAMFTWGGSWTWSAAPGLQVRHVSTDAIGSSQYVDEVFFAYQPDNHVLSYGQNAELQASSTAGEVHVRPPNGGIGTDPTTRSAPVLQGRNFGGPGWCALQGTSGKFFVYATGAFAPGDSIRPADPTGADNQGVVVDNAPADFDVARSIFGKVIGPASAGSGYAVCVGA